MNKNIIIIIFLIIGMLVIFNFRGHNQNRVIDACVAGSQKLDQPMTIEEAKILNEKFDGIKPKSLDIFLEYVGLTEKEFNSFIEPMVIPSEDWVIQAPQVVYL